MFWVLGDDDLLHEILLRLVLPISLLRAVLVCKSWYRLASDLAFLRHFRDRHPPRVIGIYINEYDVQRLLFVPIRPIPELAVAARHAGSFFDSMGYSALVKDIRGDRLLVSILEEGCGYKLLLCSPLSSAGNAIVLLPLQRAPLPIRLLTHDLVTARTYLPKGGDGRSYLSVYMGFSKQQTTRACLSCTTCVGS